MKDTRSHERTDEPERIETGARSVGEDDHMGVDPVAMVPSPFSGDTAIETIEARGAAAICWAKQSAKLRFEVLRQTNPECWMLQRTPDGVIFAKLTAKGAQIIQSVYPGIKVDNREIVDQKTLASGEISSRARCFVRNLLTGASTEVYFCKSNQEDFGGRQQSAGKAWKTEEIALNDHELSVLTGVATKAIGEITGLKTVSVQELAYAWGDSEWKTVDAIPRGYGFKGERDQRIKINIGAARKQQSANRTKRKSNSQGDEISENLKELANRIFVLAGEDKNEAKKLTHDITLTCTDRGTDNVRDLAGDAEAIEACLQVIAKMESEAIQENRNDGSCDEIGGQDV